MLGNSKVTLNMLLLASGVDVFAASGVGVVGNAAPAVPAPARMCDVAGPGALPRR